WFHVGTTSQFGNPEFIGNSAADSVLVVVDVDIVDLVARHFYDCSLPAGALEMYEDGLIPDSNEDDREHWMH
ncbi:MAG: hypothetical protein ACPHF4_09965, partial [Rubripirellula sp.]